MARPKPGADMVLSRSSDGFTAGTPIEVLTDDRNALIAVAMNGQALPFEHGFPVRLVVPGLVRVRVGDEVADRAEGDPVLGGPGVLDAARVVGEGPIKTASRIDAARRPWRQGRHRRGRRSGVGAAPRHQQGGGPGRRRAVAAGDSRGRADCGRVAPMGAPCGPRPRAPTRSGSARPTRQGRRRPSSSPHPPRTARRGGTRSRSRSPRRAPS